MHSTVRGHRRAPRRGRPDARRARRRPSTPSSHVEHRRRAAGAAVDRLRRSRPPATPLLASVLAAPMPVPATDGKKHLAYELQLTNALGQDVTLTSLAVKAGDNDAADPGRRPSWRTGRAHSAATRPPPRNWARARARIVWLDVVLDEDGDPRADRALAHHRASTLAKPMPPLLPADDDRDDVAPVTVSDPQAAPSSRRRCDGPHWLDGNSCCDMTAHRMAMNPLNGSSGPPSGSPSTTCNSSADGTIFDGDRSKPESYPYFGADIHAVADGPVVAVLDGLPEQVPGTTPTGLPLDQYGGNHVVQDIGGRQLRASTRTSRPARVKVKPGDQLTHRAGDRQARQHRQHRRAAPAFPRDEHAGPIAVQRVAVRIQVVHAGRQARLDGRARPADGGPARADAARGRPRATRTDVSPLVLDVMTYADE